MPLLIATFATVGLLYSGAVGNAQGFFDRFFGPDLTVDGTPTLKLVRSIEEFDDTGLLSALQSGADFSYLVDDSTPLVIVAGALGNQFAVRALIDGGASIEAATSEGLTLWSLAVIKRDLELLSTLIDAGGDPDFNPSQHTPRALLLAIAEQWPEGIEILIQGGADPHRKFGEKKGPTELADELGSLEIRSLVSRHMFQYPRVDCPKRTAAVNTGYRGSWCIYLRKDVQNEVFLEACDAVCLRVSIESTFGFVDTSSVPLLITEYLSASLMTYTRDSRFGRNVGGAGAAVFFSSNCPIDNIAKGQFERSVVGNYQYHYLDGISQTRRSDKPINEKLWDSQAFAESKLSCLFASKDITVNFAEPNGEISRTTLTLDGISELTHDAEVDVMDKTRELTSRFINKLKSCGSLSYLKNVRKCAKPHFNEIFKDRSELRRPNEMPTVRPLARKTEKVEEATAGGVYIQEPGISKIGQLPNTATSDVPPVQNFDVTGERKRWVQIGSRKNLDDAILMATEYRDPWTFTRVFRSRNGVFAIVIGTVEFETEIGLIKQWRKNGDIPYDSGPKTGESYLEQMYP